MRFWIAKALVEDLPHPGQCWGIWKGLELVTLIMCLSDGSKWEEILHLRISKTTWNKCSSYRILPFPGRGVSPGKIFMYFIFSPHYDGWQTLGLGSADGVSPLPRQMVSLRGPDLSVSICFWRASFCVSVYTLGIHCAHNGSLCWSILATYQLTK